MTRLIFYLLVSLLGAAIGRHVATTDDHQSQEILLSDFEYSLDPLDLQVNSNVDIEDQVDYLLWTRSNPEEEFVLDAFNLTSFQESNFDASKETYIEFHGFIDNGRTRWLIEAKDALLAVADMNVISVDYGALVRPPNYIKAASNVYKTANLTARVVDWMVENVGLDVSNTRLAGHSLGAHCAGLTGQYITSGKFARVTGMDPAGPLFYDKDENNRISPNSADFVDIIHSNGGHVLDFCFGLIDKVGHVDFYPNGGAHQMGCGRVNSSHVVDLVGACSHTRSHSYWIESIKAAADGSSTFTSHPCQDWQTYQMGQCDTCGNGCLLMGYSADITGVTIESDIEYYLATNSRSPYAQG